MRWKLPGRAPEASGFEEALLSVLGVTGVLPPDGAGFWVYGLRNAAGQTFYVGKSADILRRLAHWHKTYQSYLVSVWLVPCAGERAMITTEDFLIDRLQPALNVRGMGDEEARVRDRISYRDRQMAAMREVGARVRAEREEAEFPGARPAGREAVS